MNATAKESITYQFTTCKRCGYLIDNEEELCERCRDQKYQNNSLF